MARSASALATSLSLPTGDSMSLNNSVTVVSPFVYSTGEFLPE
jgi:hypothetical protein